MSRRRRQFSVFYGSRFDSAKFIHHQLKFFHDLNISKAWCRWESIYQSLSVRSIFPVFKVVVFCSVLGWFVFVFCVLRLCLSFYLLLLIVFVFSTVSMYLIWLLLLMKLVCDVIFYCIIKLKWVQKTVTICNWICKASNYDDVLHFVKRWKYKIICAFRISIGF